MQLKQRVVPSRGELIKATILEKYGPDYYKNLGKMGGSCKVPKGFAKNHELAVTAGRKGGQISRRGPAKDKTKEGK